MKIHRTTRTGIAAYPALDKPVSINGGAPRHRLTLLYDKDNEKAVDDINEAIRDAYKAGERVLKGNNATCPSLEDIRSPLRDGDVAYPKSHVFAGRFFLTATSKDKPEVVRYVGKGKKPVPIDPAEIYSGVFCRVSLDFSAYNIPGVGCGIACHLCNVLKCKDGEHLEVARVSAEEDFGNLEDEDDEFLV